MRDFACTINVEIWRGSKVEDIRFSKKVQLVKCQLLFRRQWLRTRSQVRIQDPKFLHSPRSNCVPAQPRGWNSSLACVTSTLHKYTARDRKCLVSLFLHNRGCHSRFRSLAVRIIIGTSNILHKLCRSKYGLHFGVRGEQTGCCLPLQCDERRILGQISGA